MKKHRGHKFAAILILGFYSFILGSGVFLNTVSAGTCDTVYADCMAQVGSWADACRSLEEQCKNPTPAPAPAASNEPYTPKYLPANSEYFDFANAEGIADMVKRFYTSALYIVGAIAFGVVIYGAVLWVISGASPSKLGEAKSWIIGAILGTILLFGAVLILNEINPNITQNMSEPLDLVGETPIVAPPPPSTGVLVGGSWPPESMFGSDASARNNLASNGSYPISVNNKSNCTSVGQTGCTSLDGLPSSTVDDLKSLANSAKEPLTVTGGTEYWLHSTHGPGKPVVDIAYDPKAWAAVQKSSDIAFYQCERNGVKVDPALVTPDHIHIKFK